MRRSTYIWLGFRITLTPLTRRIYKEGSGRLLRRNVSYIAQYFTPFGGGSEQVNKTRNTRSHRTVTPPCVAESASVSAGARPLGLIGRVRSANICGGRKLHKYVSTNVWTMKNVSTQQMSRSVRYMTLQSGTVALRWLFSCWNKHGRLSRDQSPSGHVRSQAISCLANRSHHAYVLMH